MFQIVDGRRGGGGDLADKWRRLTAALPAASAAPGEEGGDSKAQSAAGEAKPETSRRKGETREPREPHSYQQICSHYE